MDEKNYRSDMVNGGKIMNRPHKGGDEKESRWPPVTPKGDTGTFYWDKEKRKFIEGYPPSKNHKFGEAPYVIQDTMDKQYHPAACKWTDSRQDWEDMDKACGTFTSGKKQPPDPTWHNEQKKKRHKDIREAMQKSIAQLDSGTAPLTEETREMCKRQNEILASAGFKPYNVAGKKNNKKGRKNGRR